MKIHLVSDIHTEFALYPWKQPKETDVVVAAGDIAVGDKGPEYLRHMFGEEVPIIYVCGNHEFYRERIKSVRKSLSEQKSNVQYLENTTFIYKDVVFIGATLWTDFSLYGEDFRIQSMQQAENGMNDYRLINCDETENGYQRFLPKDAYKLHKESLKFIEKAMQKANDDGLPAIVVTHMAPHPNSIHSYYRETSKELNPAYASDLTKTIEKYKPKFWFHGHVHDSFDYMVGDTRVVANPRGYANRYHTEDSQNKKFNPELLVEL